MKFLPKRVRIHSSSEESEAQQAIDRTNKLGGLVALRWPAIRTIVREVEQHRDSNHFGDRIADAYRERLS